MAECKTCGKKFHACGSCGLTYNYEYEYCNDRCWRRSREYNNLKKNISNFL